MGSGWVRKAATMAAAVVLLGAILVVWINQDLPADELVESARVIATPRRGVATTGVVPIAPNAVILSGPVSPGEVRFRGEVVDEDGAAIGGARVAFALDGEVSFISTALDGHFEFSAVPGEWTMPEVSAAGYMQPQPFPSDLRLHGVDGTVVEGLRFTLTRVVLHEVSGRVVTESGPVEGASVEWRGFEGEFPRTNALGQFQVQLPDTVERLTVRHPCCRLKIQELGKPQEVEIVLVKHDARAELLKRALSGVVVDEDDRPVSGAVVSILSESGRKLTSDPQGRFSTEVQGLTVWLIATKGTATSETIDFVDSEVRVRLVTNDAAFSGRVVDQQGEPVRQFELHLRDKSGGWTVTVFSPDGTYVIEGQHAGGYKVSISGPEFPESESRNFVLGRGLKLQGVDFRLQRGVTISGHVYAEKTGERLQGVLIRSGRQVARSDADGGFQLPGLSPGRQELGADKNDFLHRDIPVTAPGVVAIGLRPQTTSGSDYEGAGLRLDFSRTLRVGEGYPVMALHPEGGARVAGILPGDELLAAEGVAAGTLGNNEFNERIRGAEGSIVKLTVRRDGRVFDVNVVRRRLVWQRQE